MNYREQIKAKSLEFRSVLSNYINHGLMDTGSVGNCSFIKTTNRVNYKPKGEGKLRIGKITDNIDNNHMIIRLDLPKDEFSDAFLMESTGFKHVIPRKQRTTSTCLKLHRARWDDTVFDTIDIKLYGEDITTYSFITSKFLNFMDLLILRATGEIIQIPN